MADPISLTIGRKVQCSSLQMQGLITDIRIVPDKSGNLITEVKLLWDTGTASDWLRSDDIVII